MNNIPKKQKGPEPGSNRSECGDVNAKKDNDVTVETIDKILKENQIQMQEPVAHCDETVQENKKLFECECGKQYSDKKGLGRHENSAHAEVKKAFKCNYCDLHAEVKKVFQCQMCDLKLSRKDLTITYP